MQGHPTPLYQFPLTNGPTTLGLLHARGRLGRVVDLRVDLAADDVAVVRLQHLRQGRAGQCLAQGSPHVQAREHAGVSSPEIWPFGTLMKTCF